MAGANDTFLLNFDLGAGVQRYLMSRYDGNVWVATALTDHLSQKERSALSPVPPGWEPAVRGNLYRIFESAPNATGKAVLARINATSRLVMIVPDKIRRDNNAFTGIIEPAADSVPAGEPQYATCRETYDEKDPSTWERCKIDPSLPRGTGVGANSVIRYSPENYAKFVGPGSLADEGLLHELVHAMRIANGVNNQLPVRVIKNWTNQLIFGSIEEFLAILVTNIYRSEKNRWGQRADHYTPDGTYRVLHYPLHDPKTYYQTYKGEIDRIKAQKNMLALFLDLARVPCQFNPIAHSVSYRVTYQNAVFRPSR